MKKVFFTAFILLVCLSQFSFAQLGSATMNMQNGTLDRAKSDIDKALESEKAQSKSKTWYYKGEIYSRIAASDPNLPYFALDKDAVSTSYEAYKKAMELESEKKGYYNDSQKGIDMLQPIAINHAITMWRSEEKPQAFKDLKIANLINPKDTTTLIYGSIMALEAKDTENYLYFAEKLLALDVPYEQKKIHYINVAISYRDDKKDIDKALEVVKKGVKDNSKDANLYIFWGELLLAQDKNDKAIEVYKEGYAKFPNEFTFVANTGKLYYDKASQLYRKLSDNENKPSAEEAKKMDAQIIAELRNAMPFLEKAHQMKPENLDIVDLLEITYSQLDMREKAEEMKKKREALEKS